MMLVIISAAVIPLALRPTLNPKGALALAPGKILVFAPLAKSRFRVKLGLSFRV